MARIKVHVLNFHFIWSHVELVIENTSITPHEFYNVNLWEKPKDKWSSSPYYFNEIIQSASSTYSFDILDADPETMVNRWIEYWNITYPDAGIFGNNCAVAAQWFLSEFAGIPKPSLSNVSLNHLAFGIFWPSFVPCPITLPGRIMSNMKFHIDAREHPEIAAQYSKLFLYTSLSLASLLFVGSMFALAVAATVLTGGLADLAIAGCAAVGLGSGCGFFKAFNTLSAQNAVESLEMTGNHNHVPV
jgi:hypothetical protein